VADVSVILSCSRDAKLRAGQTVTLGVRGSENCTVIASGSAENRISLRIEALR
jgi:hypothetical protein